MTEVIGKPDNEFIEDMRPEINKTYYYKKGEKWYESIFKSTRVVRDGAMGQDEYTYRIMESGDKPETLYVLKSAIPELEYNPDNFISIKLHNNADYYFGTGYDKYGRRLFEKGTIKNVLTSTEHPVVLFIMNTGAKVEELFYDKTTQSNSQRGGGAKRSDQKRNKKSRKQKRRVRKSRRR